MLRPRAGRPRRPGADRPDRRLGRAAEADQRARGRGRRRRSGSFSGDPVAAQHHQPQRPASAVAPACRGAASTSSCSSDGHRVPDRHAARAHERGPVSGSRAGRRGRKHDRAAGRRACRRRRRPTGRSSATTARARGRRGRRRSARFTSRIVLTAPRWSIITPFGMPGRTRRVDHVREVARPRRRSQRLLRARSSLSSSAIDRRRAPRPEATSAARRPATA